MVSDIYPMRSGKQFVNTLEDNICRHRAMDKLIIDSANNEISHMVKDTLRAYNINDWQSEPYHQNQNPAEWRYRTIKAWVNTIMNRMGAPAHCTLQYVHYILNHNLLPHLVAKSHFRFCMVLLLISASCSSTSSISQSFMLLMISTFHLKVKIELPSGLVLQSIVVIPLPTWF